MKSKNKPVIYYENELEDEFSSAIIAPRRIDGSYCYEGGKARRIGRLFWYYLMVKPVAYLYLKIRYQHKMINRECFKQVKDTGFFLYGNHTNAIADAFMPTVLCNPVDAYVIVHPKNVSMPVFGRLTPCMGAIPLPDDKEAVRNYNKMLQRVMEKRGCIAIYPEAHIWPYYTGIRNFKDTSFRYPVAYQVPVFCFTNTYRKRKGRKTPQIVTYVDGPFYPDNRLSVRVQRQQLHRQVINTMKKDCRNSDVEVIKYVKKEKIM